MPWVKKYEGQVDDAIDEAHRGLQRWLWSKIGYAVALVVGEGGNLLEILLELIFGKAENSSKETEKRDNQQQSQSSTSLPAAPEERQHKPRHSVRDALRHSSTLEDFVVVGNNGDGEHSVEFMAMYANDFKILLQHGLYVFASVGATNDTANDTSDNNNGKFRLMVFSYNANNNGGAFLISPVGDDNSNLVTLPIYGLSVPICIGSQAIKLEWKGEFRHDPNATSGQAIDGITAEIVLSNEDDRDILFNCLIKCLPWMKVC